MEGVWGVERVDDGEEPRPGIDMCENVTIKPFLYASLKMTQQERKNEL